MMVLFYHERLKRTICTEIKEPAILDAVQGVRKCGALLQGFLTEPYMTYGEKKTAVSTKKYAKIAGSFSPSPATQ
jgi:hypothetical protein